eukprot:2920747-Rhodomonas_salina.1
MTGNGRSGLPPTLRVQSARATWCPTAGGRGCSGLPKRARARSESVRVRMASTNCQGKSNGVSIGSADVHWHAKGTPSWGNHATWASS